MTTHNPHAVALGRFDPFARLLLAARLTPARFGALILLLNLIVDAALGWKFGVFYSTSGNPGLLQDLTALSFDFVILPLVCGGYLWTCMAPTQLFGSLLKNGVLGTPRGVHAARVNALERYSRYQILPLAMFIASALALAQVAAYMGWVPWRTFSGYLYLHPPMSFARLPFWFLTFYTIVFGIFNISATTSQLDELFKEPASVAPNPWHPDRCAGLGAVGRYAGSLGYVIMPIGLFGSLTAVLELQKGTFALAYPIHFFLLVYCLLAPLVFLLPIRPVHSALQYFRDGRLLQLSVKIRREYDRVIHSKKQGISLSTLQQLRSLHEDVSDTFPKWPFGMADIRRFLVGAAAPLIPAAISLGIEFVVRSVLS